MEQVPRIKAVEVIGATQLLIYFDNDGQRVYDCKPLLGYPIFHLLGNPAFFRAVRVDPGGYGISWNDNIDLSEYELWTNGKPVAKESLQRTGDTGR